MFAPNTNKQLAFDDSTLGLTEREAGVDLMRECITALAARMHGGADRGGRRESGSVITDYRYEQNVQSDSQFLKDSIGRAAGPSPVCCRPLAGLPLTFPQYTTDISSVHY